MDFSFSEDQLAVGALADRILGDKVTPDLLRAVEAGGPRFDRELWATLGAAGLLGIGLPETAGGGGFGIIEQCLIMEAVGRRLAPVPAWAGVHLGAAPLARYGASAQHERWLAPAITGQGVLSAALVEPLNRDRLRPTTRAARDGSGYLLSGIKTAVPAGTIADAVLVPAVLDGAVSVFVVEPEAPGLTITPQTTTNRDQTGHLELNGVHVDADARLGAEGQGGEILEWLEAQATVALCAQQLGVTEQALADTADYAKTRIQFERPIGSFQAVGHRCADCYIDTEGLRLTTWQAAWRLSEGLPAATEIEVAKYWAAEAGHRVAHAAVHLHGGMGVANEHTIHRYFIWAKQIEFMLGGATEQLLRIGAALAAEPA